jgi:hypothetical protein
MAQRRELKATKKARQQKMSKKGKGRRETEKAGADPE